MTTNASPALTRQTKQPARPLKAPMLAMGLKSWVEKTKDVVIGRAHAAPAPTPHIPNRVETPNMSMSNETAVVATNTNGHALNSHALTKTSSAEIREIRRRREEATEAPKRKGGRPKGSKNAPRPALAAATSLWAKLPLVGPVHELMELFDAIGRAKAMNITPEQRREFIAAFLFVHGSLLPEHVSKSANELLSWSREVIGADVVRPRALAVVPAPAPVVMPAPRRPYGPRKAKAPVVAAPESSVRPKVKRKGSGRGAGTPRLKDTLPKSTVDIIRKLRANGSTSASIAEALTKQKVPRAKGVLKPWNDQGVLKAMKVFGIK